MKVLPNLRTAALAAAVSGLIAGPLPAAAKSNAKDPSTATPVEHLVVIFQENISFDHYFATYPLAANTDGSPFDPAPGTPSVNGLGTLVEGEPSGVLLTSNPNLRNTANAPDASNPFRLSHSQVSTCDQDHDYGAEQAAFDFGLMDAFPLKVGTGGCGFDYGHGTALTMGYFDGNTVTALWNYAQNFAMSDNSFGSTFGPSTPGVLNLVAGQTGGVTMVLNPGSSVVGGTVVGDPDPIGDTCSNPTRTQAQLAGPSIADLLNNNHVSWGSFMGGFNLSLTNSSTGTTGCNRSSPATPANGGPTNDYIPHHAFFQYFKSTLNAAHTRPNVPPSLYGTDSDTTSKHQYDINDFFAALTAGNLPAVSFLKAPAFEDGHAGYSDPLLEQQFLVNTINTIELSKFWKSTAIVVMYDDSDGWYDHQIGPIVNPSAMSQDALSGVGKCGNGTPLNSIEGRCGVGPRLPLIVISPFAKPNFVDHSFTTQTSVTRFIEDNWGLGQLGGGSFDAIAGPIDNLFDFTNRAFGSRRLLLDPTTGQPM